MEKYLAIVVGVFIIAMFGSLAVESYGKSQCRMEAVKQGKSADDIQKICR